MTVPVTRRILLSRLLTRIGDQAWDFAVPLALVAHTPGSLQTAALYSLGVKSGMVLTAPRLGRLIDVRPRRCVARLGVLLQAGGVAAAAGLLAAPRAYTGAPWLVLLVLAGLAAGLGAMLMEIAVASDLLPAVAEGDALRRANVRLKQIDLGTEVGIPVLAGALLMIRPEALPLLGFLLVALVNVLSFYPEYKLLASVLDLRPELNQIRPAVTCRTGSIAGLKLLVAQPALGSMLAYAFLWCTVLTPHGVLLTAFLKDAWHLPETTLGAFRGFGAVFGLAATLVFPRLARRLGLARAACLLLVGQALCAGAALTMFRSQQPLAFMAFILLSRTGLYGFVLGETEIRQRLVPAGVRGQVGGGFTAVANALTLAMSALGAVFGTADDFGILVAVSAGAVALGAVTITVWARGPGPALLASPTAASPSPHGGR